MKRSALSTTRTGVFSGGAGGAGEDKALKDLTVLISVDLLSGQGGNASGFEFDLGDIFKGDFFGGQRERADADDISVDIELSFSESIFS